MNRKTISIYMTATCAMSIVVPGRFAIGIIIAIEVLLLSIFGILFRNLLCILKIKELKSVAICSLIVAFTILFKQILILISPETALQLSFIIYLPAISSFSSVFLFEEKRRSLKEEISLNVSTSLVFAIYILIFSLIRDIIGYGTITLISLNKIIEIVIFDSNYIAAGTFFATIPGALVLSALFLAAFLTIEKKALIIKKVGINK